MLTPGDHSYPQIEQPNSSFSTKLPTLQLAIDSTSLGEFKTCPRKYQLSIVLGYKPHSESVHLTFGLLAHGALEHYYHYKAQGQPHEDALAATVHWALRATWDSTEGHPWNSNDQYKNRFTLIRTIVWYLDKYGPNDPIQTITLANGKPAIELSFRFESGYQSQSTGEPFLLCGHLDRLGLFQGQPWISDFKTTKTTINQQFFAKFTPHNQFTIYTLAGKIFYHSPVNGIIVDGCQVAVGFSRFERQLVTRSEAQLSEWHYDLGFWLSQMEQCASAGYWPINDKSCDNYGGCEFRAVCSKSSPEARQAVLSGAYHRRTWDPLRVRGDI